MPINENTYTFIDDEHLTHQALLEANITGIIIDADQTELQEANTDQLVALTTHLDNNVNSITFDITDNNAAQVARIIATLRHPNNKITALSIFNYTEEEEEEENANLILWIIDVLRHQNCRINSLAINGDGEVQSTALTNQTAIRLLDVLADVNKQNTITSLCLTNNAIDLSQHQGLITAALLNQRGSLSDITLSTLTAKAEGIYGEHAPMQNDNAWLSCLATLIGTIGNRLQRIDMNHSEINDAPFPQLSGALALPHSQVTHIDIDEGRFTGVGINQIASRVTPRLRRLDATPLQALADHEIGHLRHNFSTNSPLLYVPGITNNVNDGADSSDESGDDMDLGDEHNQNGGGAALFAAQFNGMSLDQDANGADGPAL